MPPKLKKLPFLSFLDDFDILILGGGLHFFYAILVHDFKLPWGPYGNFETFSTLWNWPNLQGGPEKQRKIIFFGLFQLWAIFFTHMQKSHKIIWKVANIAFGTSYKKWYDTRKSDQDHVTGWMLVNHGNSKKIFSHVLFCYNLFPHTF